MVLTAAQTNTFFTHAAQMGISAATVTQMANEGITSVDDLIDFDKDTIDQMVNNLRRPPDELGAFAFGARSSKRLLTATKLVWFYDTIGRNITAANIAWNPIMQNFHLMAHLCISSEHFSFHHNLWQGFHLSYVGASCIS